MTHTIRNEKFSVLGSQFSVRDGSWVFLELKTTVVGQYETASATKRIDKGLILKALAQG